MKIPNIYKSIASDLVELEIKNKKGQRFKIKFSTHKLDEIQKYHWHTYKLKNEEFFRVSTNIKNKNGGYTRMGINNLFLQKGYILKYKNGDPLDYTDENLLFYKIGESDYKIVNSEYAIVSNRKHEKIKVDLEDLERVKKRVWHKLDDDYFINNEKEYIQRFIMKGYHNLNNMIVDHKNHDKSDNRKENLRICSYVENARNREISSINTSGTTGVYWAKRQGKWKAFIVKNKKKVHLGYFINKDDAINAREKAENETYKEFSYKNSMKDVIF